MFASASAARDALPTQISLELHANTLDARGFYTHTGRRMTTLGELAMLATLWHTRGYVLASREDNRLAYRANRGVADCTELTLLRVRCSSAATAEGSPRAWATVEGRRLLELASPMPMASDSHDSIVVDGAGSPRADGVYFRAGFDVSGRRIYATRDGLCKIGHRSRNNSNPDFALLYGWGLRCSACPTCEAHHLYMTRRCMLPHPTQCTWHNRRHHGDPPIPRFVNASIAANASTDTRGQTVWAIAPIPVPAHVLRTLPIGAPLRRPCLSAIGRRVSIFGYVRDEVDIVATWVHYHASLFGYDQLLPLVTWPTLPHRPWPRAPFTPITTHVETVCARYDHIHLVDNNSTDGTLEVLHHLAHTHGVRLWSARDFRAKGSQITRLMRLHANESELLIPLDIDEFIVLTDGKHREKTPSLISVEGICAYIDALPLTAKAYKVNRLAPAVHHQGGFRDMPREATHARHEAGVLNKWRLAKVQP